MHPRHALHLLLQAHRRVFAMAMLLLQVGGVLAPLADTPGRRSVTHAEQRGTRHPRAHNEETCVVCAVQSFKATAPDPQPILATDHASEPAPATVVTVFASRAPPAAHGSRAPPLLS